MKTNSKCKRPTVVCPRLFFAIVSTTNILDQPPCQKHQAVTQRDARVNFQRRSLPEGGHSSAPISIFAGTAVISSNAVRPSCQLSPCILMPNPMRCAACCRYGSARAGFTNRSPPGPATAAAHNAIRQPPRSTPGARRKPIPIPYCRSSVRTF